MVKDLSVKPVKGVKVDLPVIVAVAVAIGPSATKAVPFMTFTVKAKAVAEMIDRFLFRLAALNVPEVKRNTTPGPKPAVSQEPVLRVIVQLSPDAAIVIDRPVTGATVAKSRPNKAPIRSA